jgi:polyisoprenoid-binding protein YceI
MKQLLTLRRLVLTVCLLAACGMARADWELDTTSSNINFVSVKNDSVGEVHSFGSLVGFVGAQGNAQLTINLESVQTLIEIRDQRMRELLFETVKFPVATVTAQLDSSVLALAAEGGIVTTELPVTLSLHGKEKTLDVALVIVGAGGDRVVVFSAAPIVINAADFDLTAGVAALQQVAGLKAISTAVPVTLQLQFVKVK